jgi:diguanylate cyclase (GGDEF)-like protein
MTDGTPVAAFNLPDRRQGTLWLAVAILLLVAIVAADSQTNPNVTFTLFYILPAAIAAWACNRRMALVLAFASAVWWVAIDFAKGRVGLEPLAYAWNFSSRLALLIAFAVILSALRDALAREQEMARRDYVTQMYNTRAFHEMATLEIRRARRHLRPLALIYTDLDNFKAINDARGHQTGDEVLRTIAATMRQNVRVNDFIGRLGGDELAILMPDTDRKGAQAVVDKLRQSLAGVVGGNGWPVTFSMGVVTGIPESDSSSDLIKQADALMYQVKSSGKDASRFDSLVGDAPHE